MKDCAMWKARGFALVELLVVIFTILVLIALLLPTLQQSRKRTEEVTCQSNLSQWANIFQDFLQRNDGRFLKGIVWGWMWQLDDKYKDRQKTKIWFCPKADKPLYDEDGNRLRDSNVYSAWGYYKEYGSGSYGLNGYTLDQQPGFIFERGRDTTNNWRTFNVEGASNIPVFIDALRFDLWPLASDGPPKEADILWQGLNHMSRCCINRHNGGVNCLFMDWSVRKVGLKELWTLRWHRQFDTANEWTKAGGVRPEDWPEWMRNFRDY